MLIEVDAVEICATRREVRLEQMTDLHDPVVAAREDDETFADPFTIAVWRAKAEFLEMPGLRVTMAQAQRLWGFDRSLCENVLDALVRARFLAVSGSSFRRAD